MNTIFEREIRQQPERLERLLGDGRAEVARIASAIHAFSPAFVVTAARGSSDNAARYAKYLFGSRNRLVVSLGAPSLVTVYETAPDLGRALVLGISQSGESPDIVALLTEGRRQGALTVALTNVADSPLGQASEFVLDLRAGPERAVAATKSYTCELMALAMLSAALGEGREPELGRRSWSELEALPEQARQTLAANSSERLRSAADSLIAAEHLMVIGRGFNFATAFEVALKVTETSYLMANPYATPDLFHGPLALVEEGLPALVIAASGPTASGVHATLDRLRARGAALMVISNDPVVRQRRDLGAALPVADAVPEWLSPVLCVMPGQLLALALAEARGLDPDRPRGLVKVTHTR